MSRPPPAGDVPKTHRFPIDWHPHADVYACIEIEDDGPGIPVQDIEKLFDPFFSTKFTGRGLGLLVVLGIVKAHGGCIAVVSRRRTRKAERGTGNAETVGSVFRVFLPLCEEALPRPVEIVAKAPAVKGGGTVLVIDDEPQLLKLAARMIDLLGVHSGPISRKRSMPSWMLRPSTACSTTVSIV